MAKGKQGNRQTAGAKAAPAATRPGAARPGNPSTRPSTTGRSGTTGSQKPVGTIPTGSRSTPVVKASANRPGASAAGQTGARLSTARAAVRAEQQRYRQRKRYQASRPWWRGPIPIIGTVVTVGLIVALFIVLGNQGGSVATQPAPASVFQQVTNVSPTVASTVGTGGLTNTLHATAAGTPILKGAGGKPVVLYVGAEYCPYCAAERWSMIVALSRFGTFSNLNTTTSSTTDSFPGTNTFTFYPKTNYTSSYIDFQSVEQSGNQADALGKYKTLQVQTEAQQKLMDTYDNPPYSSQQGIPFLDIGNQFVAIGQGVPPQVLQGQTWQDIAGALSDPQSPMTQYIVGDANYLTAAICQATNNQPASVCGTTTIKQIEGQLAQLPRGK